MNSLSSIDFFFFIFSLLKMKKIIELIVSMCNVRACILCTESQIIIAVGAFDGFEKKTVSESDLFSL
jgi:hypothetical protein